MRYCYWWHFIRVTTSSTSLHKPSPKPYNGSIYQTNSLSFSSTPSTSIVWGYSLRMLSTLTKTLRSMWAEFVRVRWGRRLRVRSWGRWFSGCMRWVCWRAFSSACTCSWWSQPTVSSPAAPTYNPAPASLPTLLTTTPPLSNPSSPNSPLHPHPHFSLNNPNPFNKAFTSWQQNTVHKIFSKLYLIIRIVIVWYWCWRGVLIGRGCWRSWRSTWWGGLGRGCWYQGW